MVKWIHIADVHLGASPDAGDAYSKVRPQELWDTFAEVIDICEREQTDLLLIAGDLFHRQPLKKELKEVDLGNQAYRYRLFPTFPDKGCSDCREP